LDCSSLLFLKGFLFMKNTVSRVVTGAVIAGLLSGASAFAQSTTTTTTTPAPAADAKKDNNCSHKKEHKENKCSKDKKNTCKGPNGCKTGKDAAPATTPAPATPAPAH
jgi:hypothetical protein